ncbi:hypothetical protein KAR91_31200 [Candidatus Pacearchaeota archaeon]|nr:hypothetical protein [Candidatus Pacearchaeota archaeon]
MKKTNTVVAVKHNNEQVLQYHKDYKLKNVEKIRIQQKEYYRLNREKRLKCSAMCKAKNPEKYKENKKKSEKAERENLHDSYIRKLIYCTGKLTFKHISPEMIHRKRELIQLKRLLINIKRRVKDGTNRTRIT